MYDLKTQGLRRWCQLARDLKLVLPLSDFREHRRRGLAGKAERAATKPRRRAGTGWRFLFVERGRMVHFAFAICFAACVARALSAPLSGSMVCANLIFASVYSWPQ